MVGLRIGNCLDSLVTQTKGRDVEILVVDDGSSDNTASVVSSYSSVRLITEQMRGPQRRGTVGPLRLRDDPPVHRRRLRADAGLAGGDARSL